MAEITADIFQHGAGKTFIPSGSSQILRHAAAATGKGIAFKDSVIAVMRAGNCNAKACVIDIAPMTEIAKAVQP